MADLFTRDSAHRVDIAVVGGGPAGSTCARRLAQAGLSVGVLDKSAHPRYKTCGGGLVARARSWIDLDLGDDVVEHECRTVAMNLVDTGVSFEVTRDWPLVTMTMRSTLDARLLSAAQDAGARLLTPFDLVAIEQHSGEAVLRSRCGATCTATHVVAADGALSETARAGGWPAQVAGIPALESEIFVDDAAFHRLRGACRFDFEVVSDGYAWVFPKRRHLSVGVLSTRRRSGGLRRVLDRYLVDLGIQSVRSREDHGYVIPIRPRAGGLARGRILLVGDAAGLADPLTGEGISHAVASGVLAAQAVVANLGDLDRVSASYRASAEKEILAELRVAERLARLLYRHPRLRRAGFRRIGQRLCEAVTQVISGEKTYRELLGSPLNYGKLLTALARGERRRTTPGTPVPGPPA